MSEEFGKESTAPSGSERVGFCQDCGRPLTRETVRMVGSGVFCEPCLEARVGVAGQTPEAHTGAGRAGAAYVMGAGPGVVPPAALNHAPSPMVAGFLGLIPGVGAMYNGQYAKGLAHFAIFAILMSLSDGHSLFGLMAFGWYCYQIFDAYHTAKAQLEGLPLPNPFGLNEIGERMGLGKNWPGGASPRPVATPPVTPWTAGPGAAATVAPGPVTAGPVAPVAPVPPANWAGYVPPSAFASSQTAPPPVDSRAQAAQAASWASSPYQAPYTPPYTPVGAAAAASRSFPVGALWLIGLGLLFLLGINAHIRFSGLWLSAGILAGLSVWIFTRRLTHVCRDSRQGLTGGAVLACVLRWPPVVLMVLAVLFALQAANLYTLGQTWPVVVIAFGAMLLLERSVGRTAYAGPVSAVPEPPIPAAAAWTPESPAPAAGDATKDGQP